MRRQKLMFFTLIAVALTAMPVAAFAANAFTPGTFEFSPSLSFSRSSFTMVDGDEAASVTHLNFAGTVARAFPNRWQIMAGVLGQHRAQMGSARNAYGAQAGAIYNFPDQGSMVPFMMVGAGAIAYTGDESDKAMLLPTVRLGIRSMLDGQRSINVSVGYQHVSNPESTMEEAADMFDVGIGVSLFK